MNKEIEKKETEQATEVLGTEATANAGVEETAEEVKEQSASEQESDETCASELAQADTEKTVSQASESVVESEQTQVTSESVEEKGKNEPEEPKKSGSKKIAVIIIAVLVIVGLAIGGVVIAKKSGKTPKQESATLADGTPAPDSPEGMKEAHSEAAEVITGEQATEKAEIKNAEAIELIMSYSDEELGLKKEDYTFMIAQQAYVIDSKEYVQVIAAEKKENKDGTFSITPHGKFYISFDGKTVLKENMDKPGEYEKI